jgi:iron complex transport system substrate-binding protein
MFESVSECILEKYLTDRGLNVERQVSMPAKFEGIKLDRVYIADMLINKSVIIELKSKSQLNDTDKKQLLTYLKLSGHKLGLLINFGSPLIKDGIKRIINGTIK